MMKRVVLALGFVLGTGGLRSSWAGETYVNINYQGQLTMVGVPVEALCDFEFRFFDEDESGIQIGQTIAFDGVGSDPPPIQVLRGLFTVSLFVPEGTFDGNKRWLEVTVACPTGIGPYVTLSPRQLIEQAPYAVRANIANRAMSVQGIDGHSLDASDGSPANALRVDAEGDVGIAIGNPLARLHVAGAESDGVSATLRIDSSGQTMLLDGDEIDGTASLHLNSNSATDVLLATGGGSVGVGTVTPEAKLHIVGAENNGSTAGLKVTSGGQSMLMDGNEIDSNGAMYLNHNSGGNVYLGTSGGFVGIGTAAPDNKLHIEKGSAGAVTAHANSPLVVENGTSGYVSILTPEASERGVLFGEPGNNAAGGIVYNNSATPDGMQLRTNGNATRMVVDASGRVGIGTTAPTEKLDVSGNVRVRGELLLPTHTCTIRRWAYDFRPTGGGKAYTMDRVDIRVPLSAAGQTTEFASQLHFPVDARLTEFRARVEDSSASSEITVELWSGAATDQLLARRSTVAITSLTTLSAALNHVVDYSDEFAGYSIEASWTRPPNGLGDIALRWVEVDYETDQICPPR